MPCNDGGPDREQMFEARTLPAMLCGLLTVLERDGDLDAAFAAVDWHEVGCSEEWGRAWWGEHKRRDAERRAYEREREERKRVAEAALGKLSPQERIALGLR